MTLGRPVLSHLLWGGLGEWAERAACKGGDMDTFFPFPGESSRPAKEVCATCPVSGPCLEYALRQPMLSGVWGGTTEHDRALIRRNERGL